MGIAPAIARLLYEIRLIETGSSGPVAYDTLYGHNQHRWPKRLSEMRLDEVLRAGPTWTKQFKSSAAGAYQFMNATLMDLAKQYDLKAEQIFDAPFQDYLGHMLLKRRGVDAFLSGKMSTTDFARALAQEWASFPVLVKTKGAHRTVNRGQSYYTGDSLNKALVTPERIEKLLAEVQVLHYSRGTDAPPAVPVPVPAPVPEPAPWYVQLLEGLLTWLKSRHS